MGRSKLIEGGSKCILWTPTVPSRDPVPPFFGGREGVREECLAIRGADCPTGGCAMWTVRPVDSHCGHATHCTYADCPTGGAVPCGLWGQWTRTEVMQHTVPLTWSECWGRPITGVNFFLRGIRVPCYTWRRLPDGGLCHVDCEAGGVEVWSCNTLYH